MSSFQYFIPDINVQHVDPAFLAGRGLQMPLRDLLERWDPPHNVVCTAIRRGPENREGVWIYPLPPSGAMPAQLGYDAGSQHWVECGGHWLGYEKAAKPSPEELQRGQVVGGYEHKLADGRVWICPVLRRKINEANLPVQFRVEGGEWIQTVKDEYRELWGKSYGWWQQFMGLDDKPSDVEVLDACCELLSLNYRVGRQEISELGLLDSETAPLVFRAAVDGPWWQEWQNDPQKKTEIDSILQGLQSSQPGPRVSIPATPPAEPISP